MSEVHSSKIRIRMGSIELEYEGSEAFLKNELPDLLAVVSNLYRNSGATAEGADDGDGPGGAGAGQDYQLSTSTIAARLGVSSGPDLIVAAAAHLTLVLKRFPFSRSQLLSDMKEASSYYKASYSKNLSAYLDRLVKGHKLVESAKDMYALSATEKTNIERTLAPS